MIPLDDVTCRFLASAGFPDGRIIEPLRGGANNRVFRVQYDERIAVLKQYFWSEADPRNRFETERAFYEILGEAVVLRTPRLKAADLENRQTLLSYVSGRRLKSNEVRHDHVDQALNFVAELNVMRARPVAQTIGEASEACFTMVDHLACVERRLQRLEHSADSPKSEPEFRVLVKEELVPIWDRIRSKMREVERGNGRLQTSERCLSPSDFGFHNALLHEDGRLRFFDFEYAGWDDPAKMVCDFFCQPAVPVPISCFDSFVYGTAHALGLSDMEQFMVRCRTLLPLYRLKWCGITLNEFVDADRGRRAFALGPGTTQKRKVRQLEAARFSLKLTRDILHETTA